MDRQKCAGTNKSGKPCGCYAMRGDEFCLSHGDQERKESAGFGGSQPNAGRPRNPRAVDVLRERIEADVDRVLKPLFDALEAEQAMVVGHGRNAHLEMVPDDRIRIVAANALLDRGYGKPRQSIAHTGPDDGPVNVRVALDDEQRKALSDVLRGRPATRSE